MLQKKNSSLHGALVMWYAVCYWTQKGAIVMGFIPICQVHGPLKEIGYIIFKYIYYIMRVCWGKSVKITLQG